jgi:WD40 repeat protein
LIMLRDHARITAFACLTVLAVAPWTAGGEPKVIATHDRRVTAIAFSPDGKWLASSDADGLVALTNLATHKRDLVLKHSVRSNGELSTGSVHSLAFSPDGKVLATGFTDWVEHRKLGSMPIGAVRLWDLTTGREQATVRGDILTNDVRALAFSHDGKSFAAGGPSPGPVRIGAKRKDDPPDLGELRVWDRATLKLKFTARSRVGWVCSVAFSPDDKTVAFGSGDASYGDDDLAQRRGELAFWDVEKGAEVNKLAWQGAGVSAVAFAPKGSLMAVAGGVPPLILPPRDPVGRLVLWDYASKKEVAQLKGHRYLVLTAAFSPDGSLLATGGGDTNFKDDAVELKLWDVQAKRELADLSSALKPMVRSVAFSPDGKSLAAASDKTVFLWDVGGLTGPNHSP